MPQTILSNLQNKISGFLDYVATSKIGHTIADLMMVCSVLAKRMNTSEKRNVKWLKPNCQPTMAQTMNSPAQHRITVERRMMILACEEAGVFGEKESYRCTSLRERVCVSTNG